MPEELAGAGNPQLQFHIQPISHGGEPVPDQLGDLLLEDHAGLHQEGKSETPAELIY